MVPAGWGDSAYGESDPAVAGIAVWDKAHQSRDEYTTTSTLSRLNPPGLLFVGLLEVHRL